MVVRNQHKLRLAEVLPSAQHTDSASKQIQATLDSSCGWQTWRRLIQNRSERSGAIEHCKTGVLNGHNIHVHPSVLKVYIAEKNLARHKTQNISQGIQNTVYVHVAFTQGKGTEACNNAGVASREQQLLGNI